MTCTSIAMIAISYVIIVWRCWYNLDVFSL